MGMTREEKEQTEKYLFKMARLLEDGCYQQKMLLNAVHIIDEALEQEPFKPMVEIDLYSVIKQKYIEREVLDKIRAEIEQLHLIGYATINGQREIAKRAVMQILDKYKAEGEVDNGNNNH